MHVLDAVRSQLTALPELAKFAIVLTIIVGVPTFARRFRLPPMVLLLLFGVVSGPHVLGLFPEHAPIADFFAELGKLLLMFVAGLEIDLALFRKAQNRSIIFGLTTTTVPLLLGTAVGLACGYSVVPAVVIGSLLASHTLLGLSMVTDLGAVTLEPVIITIGATVMSDTLSLIVFAICVSIYTTGFSVSTLSIQLAEIAVFVPLILFGFSRAGAYLMGKLGENEDRHFILMPTVMAAAGLLAQIINLPGIVGAFMAGLAVNGAVRDKPVKPKLEFLGRSLFIPSFFVVTGFLIDPIVFVRSILDNFPLVAGIVGALLLGKWIAATTVGRDFGYTRRARLTMWALTMPQLAATLAATLVAVDTVNAQGSRLLDSTMMNAVLVLIMVTCILGPILTGLFAPLMVDEARSMEKRGYPGDAGVSAGSRRRHPVSG
jgi:Kef-type K+ transport system membrane component KefB